MIRYSTPINKELTVDPIKDNIPPKHTVELEDEKGNDLLANDDNL